MLYLVVFSGLFLLGMFVILALRKPATYDSDTSVSRNGWSQFADQRFMSDKS